MKLYSVEALFGKQGVGYVFDGGDGVRLIGMSGVGGEFRAGVLWPDADFSAAALEGEARGRPDAQDREVGPVEEDEGRIRGGLCGDAQVLHRARLRRGMPMGSSSA